MLLFVSCLVSVSMGAVYRSNPTYYITPDNRFDYYCPITWQGVDYIVRNEIRYLPYKTRNICLKCGPCKEDGMQCADTFRPCPKQN